MVQTQEQIKSLNYSKGDIIRVRSKKEISKTLDPLNKLEGCLMMNQMWEYSGQTFKILKVVDNFFDEYKFKMYQTHSPLYILEGLICNGLVESFKHRCDRSCYLLWHGEWLERI